VLIALVVAAITGLATGLGVVPYFFRDTIPRRTYDAVMGMGAGLMLSAATLGLLSAALERVRPDGQLSASVLLQILFGFALGVLALALMDRFIPHHHAGGHREHIDTTQPHDHAHDHADQHAHEAARKGFLVTGAMTLHRIPEGFAIGAGFAAGAGDTLGWVLAVAVAFQNVCEGAVMGAPLRAAGWSRARIALVVSSTGLAVPFAAVFGYLAAGHLASALPFILALASGALIYLISNEIIPETHSHGNEMPATLGLVAGFLVTIVVQSIGHAH
jgi:ZIP family zinc transporter